MSYRLISSEVRKARKPHRCIWCGQPIEAGKTYRHDRGIFEGDMQIQDWHPECDEGCRVVMRDEGMDWEFDPYVNERPQVSESAEHG